MSSVRVMHLRGIDVDLRLGNDLSDGKGICEVHAGVDEACAYFNPGSMGMRFFCEDESVVFFVVPDNGAFVYVIESGRNAG